MLIPFSNVNTTPESGIFFMTGFLRFFRRFSQINVGGNSAHFPPLERKSDLRSSFLCVNQVIDFFYLRGDHFKALDLNNDPFTW